MKANFMRLFLCLSFCLVSLSACSPFAAINEDAANQFQSLTKNQQAEYWQQKRVQYASAALEQLGGQVFNNGEEYQINLPSNLLFIDETSMSAKDAKKTYQAIVDLLNIEPTSSITILAYTNTGNTQRDFALSQSWATTVMGNLRDLQLATALVNAKGKGTCLAYPKSSTLHSHIEIHYRIQKID